jgi:hypothetical protein
MYALINFQIKLLSERIATHHRNIAAPHHMQIAVHSKHSEKWVEITKIGGRESNRPWTPIGL